MSKQREISIGLLWHSAGAGNLGVGALTVGNMISARLAAEAVGLSARFTILHFPGDLKQNYVTGDDVEIFEIDTAAMLKPSGYWRAIGNLDCILDIGAGDSFTDIYGWKRYAFIWGSKALAYLRRIPLVMSPQTIGPFSKEPYKAMAAHAMRQAFAVVARDPESMTAIRAMSPKARAVQSVDVAFQLDFTRPSVVSDGILDIGVNVSALLVSGGYGGQNDYGLEVDYSELMRRFVSTLVARKDVRVHLVGHVFSERMATDDDGRLADKLAAEFPDAIRAPNFASPSEAKSYIAGLDFLVAGRMHACIAAYSAGVPVVPIAYSRKFSGLFGGVLDYPYQVPVKGLTTDEALSFLMRCLDDREALKARIMEGQKVVASALANYDAVLRELFTSIVAKD